MNVNQKLTAFGISAAFIVCLATVADNVYYSKLKIEAYIKCVQVYETVVRDMTHKEQSVSILPSNVCYIR